VPREILPADYSQGFLRLHPDGSVTATFRINYFYTVKPPLEFTADFQNDTFCIDWREPAPVKLLDATYRALRVLLPEPTGKNTYIFSSELKIAAASNTTTGFRLCRYCGIAMLRTWRSRRHRIFVYDGSTWMETDGPDACDFVNTRRVSYLVNTPPRAHCHDDIPF